MDDFARFADGVSEEDSQFASEPTTRSGIIPTVRSAPMWRGDPRFAQVLPMLDSLPQNGPLTGPSQVFPVLCDVIARCLPIATAVVIETYEGGSQMTVWCAPDVPRYQLCAAEARAWSSLTHVLASRVSSTTHSAQRGPEPNESYVVIPLNMPDIDTGFVQFEMKPPIDGSAIGFLYHAVQRLCAARARAKLRRAFG